MAETPDLRDVPLSTCPLVAEAIDAVVGTLDEAGVDAEAALGFADADEAQRRWPDLAAWVAAGILDARTLSGAVGALGSLDAKRLRACGGPSGVVDRFLVGEVVRGLARRAVRVPATSPSQREAPILREAVAARIAVDAWPGLAALDLAAEAVALGPGCHFDPSVLGPLCAAHTLARAVGFESLVAAAAGQVPWSDALDDATQRRALQRATGTARLDGPAQADWGQALHDEDVAWLEDAFCALTTRRRLVHDLPRAVGFVAPGGLRLDARLCVLEVCAPESLTDTAADGWLDAAWPRVLLPPAVCAGLDHAGWSIAHIAIRSTDGLDDLVELLLDIVELGVAPEPIEGDGFRVEPGTPHTD
ncbi:MAG: hypothetical protein EXR79_06795 [Myxococcales bacterium]|nr:hypothetical protein [Myxococcales bacterium]